MAIARSLLLLAFATTALGSPAAVELTAAMQLGGKSRFVLKDGDVTSDWLGLGQSFRGYDLLRYDPRQEVLTLRKDGQELEVALNGPHVRDLSNDITPLDLVVRDTGPVRIALSLGPVSAAAGGQVINVDFDGPNGRAGISFGPDAPQSLNRSFVPEAVRAVVSDAEIAAINKHLATVRAKLRATSTLSSRPTP